MTDIKDKMVQCPECSFQLLESDFQLTESDCLAQKEHMEKCHPDVIIKRLREFGMLREADKFAREMADKYKNKYK